MGECNLQQIKNTTIKAEQDHTYWTIHIGNEISGTVQIVYQPTNV